MKILVAGLYFSRNLGDAVLCDCTAGVLKSRFPGAEIVVEDLLGRTEFDAYGLCEFSEERQRKDQKRRRLRALLSMATPYDKVYAHEKEAFARNLDRMKKSRVHDADLVVFAGGQVLADTLALPVAYMVKPYLGGQVPVMFSACGTGEQVSRHIQGIISRVLCDPAVRSISVRDHAEEVNRRYLSGRAKTVRQNAVPANAAPLRAVDTFDFGLLSAKTYGVTRAVSPDAPIGLGFMYPNDQDAARVKRFWLDLIAYLEEHEIPWRVFTNGSGRDMGYAAWVLRDMPDICARHQEDFEQIPATPEDLVKTIAGFRGILSFRLHSHIIAASLGVPSVAFIWDDKLKEFFRKMGCPERAISLTAKPIEIWETYLQAEKIGWDQKKMSENVDISLKNFRKAIDQYFPVPQKESL